VEDELEPATGEQVDRVLARFRELAEVTGSEVDVPSAETDQLDFELAARVDFGAEAKQELLATTSPRRRLARLIDLLGQALEAVRLERILHERAGGNGKVAPLDPEPGDER
jgi:Lon protease-like protein